MLVMYSVKPPVSNETLNRLFAESWDDFKPGNFQAVLSRSLTYVCAFHERRLVGFVNVAWDGGIHGFILDTTVHPDARRNGIGRELVRRAADAAQAAGIVWLHVDYEPRFASFYAACGFRPSAAGVMRLDEERESL